MRRVIVNSTPLIALCNADLYQSGGKFLKNGRMYNFYDFSIGYIYSNAFVVFG